jgi:TnpA family transposase
MPRGRALSDIQIEALLALPTTEPDLIRHYTLSPADLALIARRRRPHNRLGFAVQLCALRFPGRLLRPGEAVPREVLSFVADQLDLDPDTLADYAVRSQTRYDQLESLYAVYGFRTFTQPDQRETAKWLLPVALATTSGVALAGLLLEELRRRAIAAPGPSVIERLVAAALLQAERHVERQIDSGLSARQRDALVALLEIRPDTAVSTLAWTRQAPGASGHRGLARLVGQLSHLRALAIEPAVLEGVHADRVRLMVREGTRLSAQHLKVLAPLRRRAILAVTALEAITRLTDEVVGMFDRVIGKLFRRAERRAAEDLQANARAINEKVRLLAKLGDALIEARRTGVDAFAAIEEVMSWDRFAAAVTEAKDLSREEGPDYGSLAAANHALLRRVGPLFLDTFTFQGIAGAASLLRALDTMRVFYAGSRRALATDLPIGFIRRGWRPAVLRDGAIDTAAYELCLFAELRDRLRAGDVWVVGSRQYRAVEDQLVPKTLFTRMKAAGPLPVAVPGDAATYLRERRVLLEERLRDVDSRAARHMLTDVRVTGATLKITPPQAVTPEAAERLADRVHTLIPRVRITELLAEVARWTGLADCFTHLRTGLPAEDQRVMLTAVLADATNLGLTRMAEACSVASYRQLAWTAGWHLSEEGYGRALARIVAAQQAHPLSARLGSAAVSSSDGQHFPLGGHGEVAGAVNPHKGSGPAVSFYTWVSGRYAPFHIKAISVSEGEAAHVIDGLLYHGGAVDVAVHHTDGGGVSDHVFALCHLLGFRFAPRIPNLADRRLHTFGPAATWPALEPFIAGRIDEALIAAHWDDLLRLATSVRIGTVPASLMLKRLGSYPRQNGLALALREVGRIERTLFTLDWLDDPALRRQATAELNKGESRNALARAVCFHRLGRLRDRTLESQQHRASGLNLVIAAIILWNTVYMERAVRALRAGGEEIPNDLLPHLAPLGWQHINLTGDYIWTEPPRLDGDGFRPLRASVELIAA